MYETKEAKPRTPSAKQEVVLNLASAMKTEIVLISEENSEPAETTALTKTVEGSSLSVEGKKKALGAQRAAEAIANGAAVVAERLVLLGGMANHPALSSSGGTKDGLKAAEQALKFIKICGDLANAVLPKLEAALTQALSDTAKPSTKKASGNREALKKKLEAQQSYDAAILSTISQMSETVAGYASRAADEGKKIATLQSTWAEEIARYDRNVEAERKKATAIAESKQACQRGETAYKDAETDKLVEEAKQGGIAVPDLDGLAGAMRNAVGKEDWKPASTAAQTLVHEASRLRKTIAWVDQVKADFESAKQKTNGRANELEKRFDAAKVCNTDLIDTLRGLLRDANQQAREPVGNFVCEA